MIHDLSFDDAGKLHALDRLEHFVLWLACATSLLTHLGSVRWPLFLALFIAIDLIGYVPGAIATHRARGGSIARIYYVLYDLTHSYVLHMVLVGAHCIAFGFEWALLAVPLHLSADRAFFGNGVKSRSMRIFAGEESCS